MLDSPLDHRDRARKPLSDPRRGGIARHRSGSLFNVSPLAGSRFWVGTAQPTPRRFPFVGNVGLVDDIGLHIL